MGSNKNELLIHERILGFPLSEEELMNLLVHFKVYNKLKKVKLINNLKDHLTNKYPEEYTKEDDKFFEEYAGKECLVYKDSNDYKSTDWFILEESSHVIDCDCFFECVAECQH